MLTMLSYKGHRTNNHKEKKKEMSAIQNKKRRHTKRTHTSREEATDHEAEADGGHSEDEQEDEDQRGVTVGQHCSIRAHLQ